MAKFSRNVWTANKVKTLIDKKEIRFDNPVQRGLIWTESNKSKLIDSILNDYPIGQIYEIKKPTGIFYRIYLNEKENNVIDISEEDTMKEYVAWKKAFSL